MVEFLDMLAAYRRNEMNRLADNFKETKGDTSIENYNPSLLAMIENERKPKDSDFKYYQRLKEDLAHLLQYREIALSIMALHRRLTKQISTYLEDSKSKENTDRIGLGNYFLNFANDMLTPYVRYSVLFFDPHTSSEAFIRPCNAKDLENTVEFIKTVIKPEDGRKVQIDKDKFNEFLKFPLQRLHNYSSLLDSIISSSDRPDLDLDNRKLRIAKLKILAVFDSIKERFE